MKRSGMMSLIISLLFGYLVITGCAPPNQRTEVPVTEDTHTAPTSTPLPTLVLPTPTPSVAELMLPEKQERNLSPAVTGEELANLVAGNQTFAFELYQALRGQRGNLLFSPYSISMMLATIQAGAEGNTAQQIADTLHFPPPDILHPAMNTLDLIMANPPGDAGGNFQLNVTNSLWLQEGLDVKDSFTEVLATNYGASTGILDFANDSEKAASLINTWVAEQTNDTVPEILSASDLSPDTQLILLNTIYFKALWQFQFSPSQTKWGVFQLLNGEEAVVPMMVRQGGRFRYFDGDHYEVIELPYEVDFESLPAGTDYQTKSYSMVVFVPESGHFTQFENTFNTTFFNAAINQVNTYDFQLIEMPKFEYNADLALEQILPEMGMPDVFDKAVADLSGITSSDSLVLDRMLHKTFISVGEMGTEASGVTMSVIEEVSLPIPSLIIDRPFIYVIRHDDTGAILFIGRVVNPAEN